MQRLPLISPTGLCFVYGKLSVSLIFGRKFGEMYSAAVVTRSYQNHLLSPLSKLAYLVSINLSVFQT